MVGAFRRHPLTAAIIVAAVLVLLVLISPLWPLPFLDKMDVVGSAVCGRLPDHSFHIAGRQLPLCARCTGTFIGALLGFVGLLALGKRKTAQMPPAPIVGLLVGFIFLMAADGVNSYLSLLLGRDLLYQPHNILRLATGTLHGLALSIIVFPIFNFTEALFPVMSTFSISVYHSSFSSLSSGLYHDLYVSLSTSSSSPSWLK